MKLRQLCIIVIAGITLCMTVSIEFNDPSIKSYGRTKSFILDRYHEISIFYDDGSKLFVRKAGKVVSEEKVVYCQDRKSVYFAGSLSVNTNLSSCSGFVLCHDKKYVCHNISRGSIKEYLAFIGKNTYNIPSRFNVVKLFSLDNNALIFPHARVFHPSTNRPLNFFVSTTQRFKTLIIWEKFANLTKRVLFRANGLQDSSGTISGFNFSLPASRDRFDVSRITLQIDNRTSTYFYMFNIGIFDISSSVRERCEYEKNAFQCAVSKPKMTPQLRKLFRWEMSSMCLKSHRVSSANITLTYREYADTKIPKLTNGAECICSIRITMQSAAANTGKRIVRQVTKALRYNSRCTGVDWAKAARRGPKRLGTSDMGVALVGVGALLFVLIDIFLVHIMCLKRSGGTAVRGGSREDDEFENLAPIRKGRKTGQTTRKNVSSANKRQQNSMVDSQISESTQSTNRQRHPSNLNS